MFATPQNNVYSKQELKGLFTSRGETVSSAIQKLVQLFQAFRM